jgi:hypothetical protein
MRKTVVIRGSRHAAIAAHRQHFGRACEELKRSMNRTHSLPVDPLIRDLWIDWNDAAQFAVIELIVSRERFQSLSPHERDTIGAAWHAQLVASYRNWRAKVRVSDSADNTLFVNYPLISERRAMR